MAENHEFCKWLLAGCATAIVALAGVVYRLAALYRAELLRRAKRAEELNEALEKK